jgi:hypothetical protein
VDRVLRRETQNKNGSRSHAELLKTSFARLTFVLVVLLFGAFVSCKPQQKQIGLPSGAQSAIDSISADIDAGNDEKIYTEAADEWREASTLEQTKEFFKTLRTRLGGLRTRTYHTARFEQFREGRKPGPSLTVQYLTAYERGAGMETFTLIERDGRWQLARYFVNSDALKQ